LAFVHCGKYCLVVLTPETLRLMMTPDLAETSGEQAYAEMPMVSTTGRGQLDRDASSMRTRAQSLPACVPASFQSTVFATSKVSGLQTSMLSSSSFLPIPLPATAARRKLRRAEFRRETSVYM
jgi:hypothetical protein